MLGALTIEECRYINKVDLIVIPLCGSLLNGLPVDGVYITSQCNDALAAGDEGGRRLQQPAEAVETAACKQHQLWE